MPFSHTFGFLPSCVKSNSQVVAEHHKTLTPKDEQTPDSQGLSEESIVRSVGVWQRRVFENPSAKGETPLASDLSVALLEAGRSVPFCWPRGIELGLFAHVTTTPDGISPATAHRVHHKMQWPSSLHCFDVSSSCSSFLSALRLMHAASLAQKQTGLIVASEVKTVHLRSEDPRLLGLFADGAVAGILRGRHEKRPLLWASPLLKTHLAENIRVVKGGSNPCGKVGDKRDHLEMREARLMYRETVTAFVEMVNRLQQLARDHNVALRRIYLHQANANILAEVRRRLPPDLAQRLPVLMSDLGNVVSASQPLHRLRSLILEHIFLSLKEGDQLGLISQRRGLCEALAAGEFPQIDVEEGVALVGGKGTRVSVKNRFCGSEEPEQLTLFDSCAPELQNSWLAHISDAEWTRFFEEYGSTEMPTNPNLVDAWVVAGGGFQCLGLLCPSTTPHKGGMSS